MHWMWKGLCLLLFIGLPAPADAEQVPRSCDEWNAVYAAPPDEEGVRVLAEIGPVTGSDPMPFTLTGVDASGGALWVHRTKAWCFLGSGGCHVGLRAKGQGPEDIDFKHSLRLLFVRSSKTDTKGTPDILVLSGLRAAFLDAAKSSRPDVFAVERFPGAPDTILPPDAFYFERCGAG